jgi:hypothetical protein
MSALFSLYAVIFSAALTLRSERSSRLEGRWPDGHLHRARRPRSSFETQVFLSHLAQQRDGWPAPQDEDAAGGASCASV